MRPVTLYARSRGVPAAVAALPVVVFLAWSVMHSPWTAMSASLTSLAAVLVITVGLAGQDPELDRSTAVPWPVWRFWHLMLAGVLAAIPVLLVQELGQGSFGFEFVVRDVAGMVGLAGLAATAIGARFAAAAPVLWWAVSAIMAFSEPKSVPGRMLIWPQLAPDDAVAMWTAGVLFLSGITAYVVRGGRR